MNLFSEADSHTFYSRDLLDTFFYSLKKLFGIYEAQSMLKFLKAMHQPHWQIASLNGKKKATEKPDQHKATVLKNAV